MGSKLVSLFLLTVLCKGFIAKHLKLKQVLILSRHNIRYPLGEELHRYSGKPWPRLAGPPGFLTPKGAQMEGFMGEYFSEWFKKEQFLTEGCPDEDTVYVYANTFSRTKATARAFINSLFKSCYVPVYHKNTTASDPLFDPVIHNTTQEFKYMVLNKIYRKLHNNYKLKAVYSELNKILEIEGSEVCKQEAKCDLTKSNNDRIIYEVGQAIGIKGSFSIANSVVDAFTMSYYDGMPIQDIAWGQITTLAKWNLLLEMERQNQDIKYTTAADDLAAPFVKYLTKVFKNYDVMPKLLILVGHDTTLNTVAASLEFESFELPNQFENYPIGGKYVFQRWTDNKNDYLKIEYVYPSWLQLRNGAKYSLESPPERVVMRLNWCNTDEYGFCPWNEFVNKL